MKFQPTAFRVWDAHPDRCSLDPWVVDARSETPGQTDKTRFEMRPDESVADVLKRVESYAQDCSDYYDGFSLFLKCYDSDDEEDFDHPTSVVRLTISHWQSEADWEESQD